MAESYLSTIWYRVADLQPKLRNHVSVHRHRYRGRAWYVLHDHASGRVHRFTPGAYMLIGQMDGGRTVDEVWRALAEAYDEDAPGQDEVIRLLSRLHQNDLIRYSGSPDVADLLERYNRNTRQIVKQNLLNPMSFRLPLFDPDAFLKKTLPWVRPLTGWFGLLVWLVVVAAGILTAAMHWEELTRNLVDQMLAASNLMIALVTYPLLKALHELAHGYLIRARGGEVREMGVMFLVFFPVPYVDASAAAAFRSKWSRAAVSAGGIFVETIAAAVAVMVWAAAEPGLVRAVAYNVVLVGGISTVLVNGNPLLKFDGYYVLADLIEIPNFGTRANRYWGHIIQRHLFGA
ncbi:PqqD family protein, partial [Cribrihabitans sp. XS_ASV171]